MTALDVIADFDIHEKDTDRSGNIGFNEFAGLYKYIEDWQGSALSPPLFPLNVSHLLRQRISSLGCRSQRYH